MTKFIKKNNTPIGFYKQTSQPSDTKFLNTSFDKTKNTQGKIDEFSAQNALSQGEKITPKQTDRSQSARRQNLSYKELIKDFFAHPMRIFFLASVVCIVYGCASFFMATNFVSYHQYAFLSLFAPLAYAGFLFTAIPDWTNFNKDVSLHSKLMFVIFVFSLISSVFDTNLAFAFMCMFWLYLTLFCAYLLWLDRNVDNFSVLGVLAGFSVLSVLFVLTGEVKYLSVQVHLNALAVVVMSFRVGIVTAREALVAQGEYEAVFVPNFVYKNLNLLALFVFIVAQVFEASDAVMGYISLGVALVLVARLSEWAWWVLLKHHYNALFVCVLAFLALGYGWYGVSLLGGFSYSYALHLIAICGVFGAIMLIYNIAGLRHSWQNLCFLSLSRIGFVLLFLSGVFRAVLGYFYDAFYIAVPAVLLGVGFVLWGVDFFRIFKDYEFSEDPE